MYSKTQNLESIFHCVQNPPSIKVFKIRSESSVKSWALHAKVMGISLPHDIKAENHNIWWYLHKKTLYLHSETAHKLSFHYFVSFLISQVHGPSFSVISFFPRFQNFQQKYKIHLCFSKTWSIHLCTNLDLRLPAKVKDENYFGKITGN